MKRLAKGFILFAFLAGHSIYAFSEQNTTQDTIRPRLSTDEVENQIKLDRKANPLYESKLLKPIQDWKIGVAESTGFNWSIDYSALFMGVSESLGESSASSGMVRFFGFWDLVNRGTPNKGSLNWKVENRHRYSEIPPSELGFESGYVGIFEPVFSNQQNRLTNLYWKQYFAEGTWAAVGGFLDVTDFVDVYLLASPWTGFNNFVFSTGSDPQALAPPGPGPTVGRNFNGFHRSVSPKHSFRISVMITRHNCIHSDTL